jgi:glutaconate CoA-transferase subunit B
MTRSLRERADLLTILLGREVDNDSVVVMGTGTPLTAVATLFALRNHAAGAAYTTPLAGGMSVVPHTLSLGSLERAAYDHAVMRSTQIIDLWEMATINPKVATRWLQFFRPAQMDQMGNMNNSLIGPAGGRQIRLPGSVGIGDMAAFYPRLFAYVTRHNPRAFPQQVDFVSAPGTLGTVEQRQARGLRWGRPLRVFTDLCVFEFDPEGRMELASVHPGVEIDEVVAATGFAFDSARAAITPAPSASEQAALEEIDPHGLRLLELLPARERRQVITEALERERSRG